jgi:hypothetical protein
MSETAARRQQSEAAQIGEGLSFLGSVHSLRVSEASGTEEGRARNSYLIENILLPY